MSDTTNNHHMNFNAAFFWTVVGAFAFLIIALELRYGQKVHPRTGRKLTNKRRKK